MLWLNYIILFLIFKLKSDNSIKKSSIAVAAVKGPGHGIVRVNGLPLNLIEPNILKIKLFEPFLLLDEKKLADIDIRVRVRGGGKISQIYAIRQAIAKGIVLYFEKYIGEVKKTEIRDILLNFDRSLLVADSRVIEPKKFGGRGARARYQKSYR